MTELGPFSYREVREKQNIVQVQETISYGSYIAYEFDREASCEECEFNTNVTVINPVIVMIDYTLEKVRFHFHFIHFLITRRYSIVRYLSVRPQSFLY